MSSSNNPAPKRRRANNKRSTAIVEGDPDMADGVTHIDAPLGNSSRTQRKRRISIPLVPPANFDKMRAKQGPSRMTSDFVPENVDHAEEYIPSAGRTKVPHFIPCQI